MPRPIPPRRRSRDYLLPFLIIVALGVIAALLLQLWGLWGGEGESSLTLSGKAKLDQIAGEVEVYLPASGAWKITSEAADLEPGESVRTGSDGSAVLTFDDGSAITLANSSEIAIDDLQNAITKKTVALALARGAAAVTVGTSKVDFTISTELLKIHEADGHFLLQVNDDENLASSIDGGFVATVLDPQNKKTPELKNFVVEANQTVEISERRVNLLRIGGEIEIVKATPNEILNSPIYLAAKSGQAIETAPSTTDDKNTETAENTTDSDKTTTDAERDVLPAPLVTTGGGSITAVAEPVKVAGKVSPKIAKVEVAFENEDAFALSKFVSGSGEWSYNASRDFGNLKVGVNNYSVVGYDADGNKTPVAKFQIVFNPAGLTDEDKKAAEVKTEPGATDGVPTVGSSTFSAPTVSQPANGATVTEAPVTFIGTVPAGTKQVLVNEYPLSKFTAGSTSWNYRADPKFSNLKEGENEYEIVAVSETGEKSSVTIKIIYKPAQE
ncbi:MAG: FecR domain-containing protein [Patescibacteria group bacterium]